MTICRRLLPVLIASAAPCAAQDCRPFWTGIGSPIQPLQQYKGLRVFDDGSGSKLYASGRLIHGGHGVARWDGVRWEVLDQGIPPFNAFGGPYVFHDGTELGLFMYFTAGMPSVPVFWRWNGSSWIPDTSGLVVPPNTGPRISYHDGSQWVTFGLRLLNSSNHAIVQWTGDEWVQHEGIFNSYVTEFAAFDDGSGPRLHVAGWFSSISGVPAKRIARWTGSQWEPLGSGLEPLSSYPRDMIVHDDGRGDALYVADVDFAGGALVNRIARWDGKTWSDVGGGILPVGIVTLHVLASFDDGRGPALYAGGYMQMAGGGVPVRRIARYDGVRWDNVGGGLGWEYPNAMAVYDDGRGPSLFVGGHIESAGAGAPGSIYGIAQWVGCTNQCYADCDNSSTHPRLNIDDFTCFVRKFAYGDPYVDCNQDGQRSIDDFTCFINRFAAGCE